MTEKTFTIHWQTHDGYAGGSRPQSVKIQAQDIVFNDAENSHSDLVTEVVQDDFAEKVSWSITNREELDEWIKKVREEDEG